MKNSIGKRLLCGILAIVLVLGYIPIPARAAQEDGLCPHHTQHTPECGYVPAVEGQPCGHEHTEECYRSVTECVHTHGDCGYVPAVEGHGCDCQPDENGEIVHTEGCGYVKAVAGVPCDHVCSEDSGCIHSVLDCRHVHDGDCGYAEAKAETPCTYDCVECATEETSVVGGTASEGEADADQEAADPVAAQIAALPTPEEIRVMSAEERSDAYEQVQSAYNAYNALTGTQKALIPNAESTFASLFACFDALAEPDYTVLGSGTCGEDLTWELTDDGTLTIAGTGAMKNYPQIGYAPWYAYRSQICSVMIGEGVTSIGRYAFSECASLTSVTIPAGVTSIGDSAFRDCASLTEVTIPAGVTSIGYSAFDGCASLTSVTIPEGVTSAETLLGPGQTDTAVEDETDVVYDEIPFQLNPLYEGLVDPADYENWEPEVIAPSTYAAVEYLTEEEAAARIREYMCARVESFTVTFVAGKEYAEADFKALFAQAFSHTGIPTEGDYLRWQYAGFGANTSYSVSSNTYRYTANFTVPYYTTADQEEELNVAVAQLLNQLNLSSKSDYEKIKGIYDYICKNVTYDRANLNDDSYKLKFTAYAALIQGTAVCQGYSVLLYRLALTLGIDCRFVGGTGNGVDHGWNIVKLGDRYYNADATWDAGQTYYQYFLAGPSFDSTHTRDDEYTTETFNTAYPMAGEDYDPTADVPAVIASGTCGDALTWTLTNDGALTISGTGAMDNYAWNRYAPWYAYRSRINSVMIGEGVTSIGGYAFDNCTSLTKASIPESVTTIGGYVFENCTSLTYAGTMQQWMAIGYHSPAKCKDGTVLDWGDCDWDLSYILDGNGVLTISGNGYIYNYSRPTDVPWDAYRAQIKQVTLPAGIAQIGNFAFSNCTNLESVNIPNGVESIGQSAFYRCSSLRSVSFPNTLQTIGADAFTECTSLTEITFDHTYSSQLSIGRGAFSPYDDGSYGPPASPINLATTVYVPSRLDINPAIRNYPWAGTSDCSRDVTYVTMNPGVSVVTGGDYRNEVAVDQTIPMIAEVGGVEDSTVTWSVVNGTGTAAIDQNGYLTGRTTGTVTVYATAANGLEGSCTVNVLRYVEDITILLNGKQDIRRLGIGEKLQLSALLTPENTTTSGVTWSVEDGTGSASIQTGGLTELTGVRAGTVTLTATAKDSKQGSARLELTVTDTIRSYAVTGGNLYYNTETGFITGSDGTVTDAAIPAVIDGVTIRGIAPYAFASRRSLASASIPNTVTEIGDHAFDSCTNLSTLRFVSGSSLTTIGEYAFSECSSLVSLTIPDSVTNIGRGAFYLGNHSKLKDLTLSGELDTRGRLAYDWGYALESVTLTGSKIIGYHHVETGFHYGDRMPGRDAKKVTISDSVKTIEAHAFCNCGGLTDVSFGTGVTAIEDYAFSICYNLTQVIMGDSVQTIGDHAFYRCDELTQVTMGNSVQTIGGHAFSDCDKLTQVTMGDSVQTIGDDAFYSCDELTLVTMGDSIQTIGDYAFSGCGNLTTINLPDSLETIGTCCFSGCEKLHLIDLSAVPDVITEKKTLLTGKADIPAVLVRATGGKMELGWRANTIEGEPDCWKIADWYQDQSGQYWLQTRSSGKFLLSVVDNYTGIRGSKVVEVKAGTVIRPTDTDYLVSGGTLQLSAWQMPAEEKLNARWAITTGQDYATLSPTGLLTAKPVTQVCQVTVTATPMNGGEAATKTIRILPKATSIQLKLGDTYLSDMLNVDSHPGRTLTLSAQSYPEGALNEVSWTSSNTRIATVNKQTGQVTLLTPGTVTITATATDGSGVKTSVKLNVIYLDAAKTLKAFAEVPPIGLQPGQTTAITVSGENPIAPENLIYTTSNASIATVDEQGVLAAGTKPGTVTITAALKGDPLKRKATVKVPVIAMQAEELSVAVDGAVKPELRLDKDSALRTFTLTAQGKNYQDDDFTPNVTWVSMDPAVASVTVARDGTVTLTIPANASGECFVTATSKDLAKITARLKVTVRDYTPRLITANLTVNKYAENGTVVDLRESYGNVITAVELVDPSGCFTFDEESMTLRAAQATKNGAYSNILMNVTCADGLTYPFNLRIQVTGTLPGVTVKQAQKFNLFYRDSKAELTVSASGQTIEAVELTDTDDFRLEYLDGKATLHYTDEPAEKPDTKGTLLVYLEGYSTPVSKAITISTTTAGPRLSLTPSSSTINTALGDSLSVDLRIWNQAEGVWLEPDNVEYSAGFATITNAGDTLTLTLDDNVGGTVSIWVRQNNWARSVKLSHKVSLSSKKPVLSLGKTTLTLNSYFTQQSAATPVTLSQGNLTLNDVKLTSTARPGTAAAAEAEKLNVYYSYDDGSIRTEIPGDAPKPGTYSYSVKGILSDGSTEISGGTLRVTVSASVPRVKLSASSVKLNKSLAGAECVQITPTVGAGYTITGFTETSDWVDYNTASGKLEVKLTPGAVNGKYTIKLTPILCDEATGQEVNHPTQLSLTVQVYNSEKLGVSLSARGKLDTLNPDSVIVYTPRLTNCIGAIDGVSLDGQDKDKFCAELADGKIVLALRDGEDYATNVTYKVQFRVSACGKEILSPVMNVKVTQSAVKRTVTPGSLTLYQAQRMPLTLRLTQSMGEIDDISISTKTSSELIKALGGDGINATIEGNTAGLKLTVENAALLKAGKSYTLYLDVTPKNNATNLNPAQVRLTVKVMK